MNSKTFLLNIFMKHHIIPGIILISAMALSSCSTQKLASNGTDDDVYNGQAKAGEAPVYAERPVYRDENEPAEDGYEDDYYTGDDDYYYYDDYASRINRFGYFSPFGYYDNMYYGYTPYGPSYGIGLGWNSWGGWNAGFGLGFGGYGYSPWGYGYGGGLGYGYGGYYSPYSYWGTGWGGYPYWGIYSAYRNTNPRPYLGSGVPSRGYRPGMPSRTSVNGMYPGVRSAGAAGRGVRTNSAGRVARPASDGGRTARPSYTPPSRPTYTPPSNSGGGRSSGGGSFGGGGGGGRSGGGRGGRN